MKSLFDQESYNEICKRISNLSSSSQRQWGKMDVGQMLAHCKEAFKVPLLEKSPPRMFMGLLMGWMMKAKLYNDSPWGKSLPTAPQFKINNERDFENERNELTHLIEQFHRADPAQIEKIIHPFFGKFTGGQWGQAMYKHLDHHLVQFGV